MDEIRDPKPPNKQGPAWHCRSCGYKLNTGDVCLNCGRSWFGEPSEPVDRPDEIPFRPGLR